jgi:beta-aspartyl-peptidase (threonine type)
MMHRHTLRSWLILAVVNFIFIGSAGMAFAQDAPSNRYSIAIHGGAGVEPDKLNAAEKLAYEEALKRALFTGRDQLAKGGTSLDAVEQTIRVLEDEPLFNAGRGAVFNNVGTHELDAAIADGKTHNGGAVAGVTTIKNPISLARLVMTDTNHVLLISDGAEKFADEMKSNPSIERVPNSYFSTEHRRAEWKAAVEKESQAKSAKATGKGTVGCVAFDSHGNLAAGTSTGGLTNKKWGRVGSVPILGAGTFADNETLAISGTGIGEHFIRNSVGFHLHALMKYRSMSLAAAVEEMTDRILEPDTAGIIAIDSKGEIVMRCNTPGMSRASADSVGTIQVLLAR